MTELSPSLEPQLLADLGWVRALARSLVRDEALADDVAQEACLLALSHRPKHGLRAWCTTVVRNLLRQRARGERRRHEREAAVARPEPVAAADDLVVRAHAQRDLVERVLALDEPYRGAILLRYFEGLPPREIAARTGVPVATVQSRLTRALRALRARLDTEHGSGAWLAAFLPLGVPSWSAPVVVGGAVMNTKAAVAGVVLTVALSVGAYVMWDQQDDLPRGDAGTRAPAVTGSDGGSGGGGGVGTAHADASAPRRTRAPEAGAPGPAPGSARTYAVRGRALLVDGIPAGNVGLALVSDQQREVARTRGDGTFDFTATTHPLRIVAADAGLVTLCAGAFDVSEATDTLVVLARAVRFAGRVVDQNQQPLANAHVRVHPSADWASRLGVSLESTENRSWIARSDRDGRFAFAAAPNVPGSTLRAVLDGYQSQIVKAPEQARDDLEIVLARPTAPVAATLRGRVLTQEGQAGSGARVALGLTTTLADDKGFFELDLRRAVTADQLRAVKQDYQPAILDRPAEGGPRGGWPEHVELRLGPPALSLAGVVLDHEGKPVADARVWLADQTPFGVLGHMPLATEGLAAGATIPPQALETAARLPDNDGDNFNDYTITKPPANACWPFVTTDRSGHFTLRGLIARDYTVKVLDGATLQVHSSGPHAAGAQDLRIRMPAPDVFAQLTARVVCRGKPMANVNVALRCTPFDVRSRTFGGTVEVKCEHAGGRTVTDQEGRFTLANVQKQCCHLILRGEGIVPREHRIDAQASAAGFDIEVDARCQVQVVLRAPLDRADSVAAVDDQGQPLELLVLAAGSTNAYTEMPLHDGKSQVFSLSSRAKKIVLLKNDAPAGTIELNLQPGVVNVVEG